MAHGHENLIPFNKRSKDEAREYGSKGGKASGESRRRKAAMRDTMNRLLTMQAEVEGLSDILRADGGESTYEELITMAMIEKALRGDVNAFNAIKATVGQTDKSTTDLEEQNLRMAAQKAKMGVDDEDDQEDDGFMEALKGSAEEDWKDGGIYEPEDEETDI
ncbi:KGG domain-containing protein [Hungatella sp.]|uniref:KGG domain-containing protein n=1 Tax=Hungatella sp. TaxID=2613924 RepID=UPI0029014687|nr:KGG domain-containing protein [Hungatella hathewayi]